MLISITMVDAEETSPAIMLGINGGATLNMHQGTFNTYDGILDCGSFKDATKIGWYAGNVLDIPLSWPFSISGRVYFYKADGDFESLTQNPPRISLDDGSLVYLNTEQVLETNLDYIHVEALAKYNFTDIFYAALGPGIGFATHTSFSQKENIIEPQGVTFRNGESSRLIMTGDFDDNELTESNIRITAHLLAGMDYPLTKRLYLNAEIGYAFPFTKVLDNSDWAVSMLHAGVGIKFAFRDSKTIIREPVETAPTPPPPPPPIPVASLYSGSIFEDGSEKDFADILVTEQFSREILPLLPYIFFESSESEIPGRYHLLSKTGVAQFDESQIRDSVLGVYHHILNIVGERMQIHEKASLKITGCIEPLDDGANSGALAKERAEAVKDYLVNIWDIAPSRISTGGSGLPAKVSNRNVDDGRQENRRAEISSDDPRILAPVRTASSKTTIIPETILLKPRIQNPDQVSLWQLNLTDFYDNEVWSEGGSGPVSGRIEWNYDRDAISSLARINMPTNRLTGELKIADAEGNTSQSGVSIPIRYRKTSRLLNGEIIRDSLVERYNLIFFDFDKPEISEFNKRVFNTILQRIRTNSKVSVTGFTDRLGEESYNAGLSERRAEAVKQSIMKRVVPDDIIGEGVGETLIYNNELPEGRFYNRTVIIEIKTPVDY